MIYRDLDMFAIQCQNNTDQDHKCEYTRGRTAFGQCVVIHSHSVDANLMQSFPGLSGGMSVVLDLHRNDFMESSPEKYDAGLMVYVHERQEPAELVSQFGTAVRPGSEAYFAFTVQKFIDMQPPFGECNEEQKLAHFPEFSYRGCLLECDIQHSINVCKCRYARTEKPVDLHVCQPQQFAECLYGSSKPENREHHDDLAECRKSCKPECQYISFDSISVSTAAMPTARAEKKWAKKLGKSVKYVRYNSLHKI
ncbi:acid-sensing ion channel 1-like [Tubulanus polymorphus]|uniref:acid-sensing ion channel 1-like n=1 Tax=Tubulanus polymorphus TaxID=672921 RepID=UPI003DA333BA